MIQLLQLSQLFYQESEESFSPLLPNESVKLAVFMPLIFTPYIYFSQFPALRGTVEVQYRTNFITSI